MRTLVSVLMLAYNHEQYIKKAIKSVIEQKTNFIFELVIGEDCSDDATLRIILEYAKQYPSLIKVVQSDANVGMVRNFYRSFVACSGKYVAFCEGDDWWHSSDKLQKQVEYMECHLQCGLVCSDFDVCHTKTGKISKCYNKIKKRNPEIMKDIIYTLRGISGIQTCTVMAKLDICKRIIESDLSFYLDPSQPCLDRPLWMGIMQESEVGYIDESLAIYSQLEQSATQNKDPAKLLKISIQMKEQILFLIEKYNIPDKEMDIQLNDLWRRKLKLSFYENNSTLAIECKEKLNSLSPIELIQFLGACNKLVGWIFSPLFKFIYRGIPVTKY